MDTGKKAKLAALIWTIVFVVYNIIVFVIAGFTGHTATFWLSWIFMLIAFVAVAVAAAMLGKRNVMLRDWLFGFPVMWHTTAYVIVEFATSTLFIIFEKTISLKVAVPVQLAELAVYLVFAISCFIAKEHIDEVQTKVADKTTFIKLLRADMETLTAKCSDETTRALVKALAERVRYSDPISSEALFELEKDISLTVAQCDEAISSGDFELAQKLCKDADNLLTERNNKCKALK